MEVGKERKEREQGGEKGKGKEGMGKEMKGKEERVEGEKRSEGHGRVNTSRVKEMISGIEVLY